MVVGYVGKHFWYFEKMPDVTTAPAAMLLFTPF